MKRHWMPLYIADYLAGTAHLTTAEHGAYLLLIMHYWSKGAPPISDEVARRVTRMTNHQWSKSLPVLKSFFLEDWRHERLDGELVQVAEKSRLDSANASKSHVSRNRLASDSQCITTITIPSQNISDEESRPRKSAQDDKWSFCLTAAIIAAHRRDHDETTAPEPHTGLQGQGGTGRHQGRSHDHPTGRAF